MKVNCLACGHTVDLDETYNDYAGLIKCFACNSLLEIRTDQGQIKTVQLGMIVRGLPDSSKPPGGPHMAEAAQGGDRST